MPKAEKIEKYKTNQSVNRHLPCELKVRGYKTVQELEFTM